MEYYSTRDNQLRKSFKDVLFQGLSKDGGLFLPCKFPNINIGEIRNQSYEEVAFNIIKPFIGDEIKNKDLHEIINLTYKNFDHAEIAPLIKIKLGLKLFTFSIEFSLFMSNCRKLNFFHLFFEKFKYFSL